MSDLLDAIDRIRPDRWVIDRLLVQADELLMWQFGWTQGVGDEAYLESSLCWTAPETLVQLQSHFQTLNRLPAVADEQDRRSRLLKIITDSIPKAEAFAASESVTGAEESPTDSDGS